jgi:hypothetical protein
LHACKYVLRCSAVVVSQFTSAIMGCSSRSQVFLLLLVLALLLALLPRGVRTEDTLRPSAEPFVCILAQAALHVVPVSAAERLAAQLGHVGPANQ